MTITRSPLGSAEILAAVTNDATKWDGADIDTAISSVTSCTMLEFRSEPKQEVAITTSSGTKTLNDVVLPNITDLTIQAVYIGLYIDSINNSSGAANYLGSNATLQVKESVAGSFTSGLVLQNESLYMLDSGLLFGGLIIGNTDVSSQIAAFNKTYNFQILTAVSQGNNLNVKGVQSVIRIIVKS